MSKPSAHNSRNTSDIPAMGARPAELEDWLNARLYHPLSARLAAVLSRTPVTPNMVSVTGGLSVLLAAYLYTREAGLVWPVLGLIVHMAWHVIDGADGDLARMTGRASELGEIVDGASDYASHFILYFAVGFTFGSELFGPALAPLGGFIIVTAGFARIPQSAFYETQRRQYQAWVYGKPWLRASHNGAVRNGVFSISARTYLALSNSLACGGERVDAVLEALPPNDQEEARALIREAMIPLLQRQSVLSSNYRTLVFGAAMIAGVPALIVVFELIALTVVLILYKRQTSAAIAALINQLSAIRDR
ncbi:MAG: CDP-alcohol phosphatidyltransferase family protein [Pseudomonadota bacterium]|nr:CDP-alcohol phosphatidyltransferase family protein [Pseudomonadota bacterium]